MKGSAFKLGGVQGTSGHSSALKQASTVHSAGPGKEGFEHDVEANYQPQSKNQASLARYGQMFTKGRGDNTRYGDRLIPGRVQWIREKFGRSLTKKQQKKAEIAYYQAHPPTKTTYEAKGEAPAVRKDAMSEKSTTEKPMTKAIHETGKDTRSELNKSLRKGYFNKGEGSEYIATRPRPEDFGTFEEYQAALRKHEMDYPNVNHESP